MKFDEKEFLVDSVMAQKTEHARELLHSVGYPKSGTKEVLRERLEQALDEGKITLANLAELLDTVDAWGRQHVILYSTPSRVPTHLKTVTGLESTLKNIGWNIKVNEATSHINPTTKELRLVSLKKDRLRIEWVETRRWNERLPHLDHTDKVQGEEVVYQASKKRYQRAISFFEWNFTAETAELFIHRLPSGTRYDMEELVFKELLKPLIDLDTFDKVKMRKALTKLKDTPGVRERKTNYVGASGAKLSMQSSSKQTTIAAVPELKQHRDLLRNSKLGAAFLNCFWEEGGNLQHEVHTHIDGFGSRVGFLAQYSEASVRYVLSRIRKAAS